MTAFRPGASPPPVLMATRLIDFGIGVDMPVLPEKFKDFFKD
jgi:hypothetical protein